MPLTSTETNKVESSQRQLYYDEVLTPRLSSATMVLLRWEILPPQKLLVRWEIVSPNRVPWRVRGHRHSGDRSLAGPLTPPSSALMGTPERSYHRTSRSSAIYPWLMQCNADKYQCLTYTFIILKLTLTLTLILTITITLTLTLILKWLKLWQKSAPSVF